MPGFAQARSNKIEINPSYFHPYAFKFFKKYDKKHDWEKIIESSYYYIMASSAKTKTGLPPNWFLIENGEIVLENSERSDFSYDAIRIFKKIYIDYIRTGDKRDLPILAKSKFFIQNWKESKFFYTNYKANGQLRDLDEFVGSIMTMIAPISIYNQKVATEIFNAKIKSYYFSEKLRIRKDYYAKNLLWHGCHFYYRNSSYWKGMNQISKDLLKK